MFRRAYNKWRAYNKTVRELSSLSDRELYDIGVTRADIFNIAKEARDRGF